MAEIKKLTINGVEYDLGGSGSVVTVDGTTLVIDGEVGSGDGGTREVLIHNGQETCDFSLSTKLEGNTYTVEFPALNNKYLQVDLETNAYEDNALGLGEDGVAILTFPDMRNTKVYIYGNSISSANGKTLEINVAKSLNDVTRDGIAGGSNGICVSGIGNYVNGSYISYEVVDVYNLIIILEFDEIGHCTVSVSRNNYEY